MSDLAASATATARFPRHHALRCRTSLATHLATVVAIPVDATLDLMGIKYKIYRPLSLCGHLDFTPFQLIVTQTETGRNNSLVPCAMNVSIDYCYWKQGHDQDGASVIKVHKQ